jgi:hypothetical protein
VLVLAIDLLASIGSLPSYWDTLPVGIHGGIRQRPQSDIAFLTTHQVPGGCDRPDRGSRLLGAVPRLL